MMIQSVTKTPARTVVIVSDVSASTTSEILRMADRHEPNGVFDVSVDFGDDFSGPVVKRDATVTYWTD